MKTTDRIIIIVTFLFLSFTPTAGGADTIEPSYSGKWQSRSAKASGQFTVYLTNDNGKLDGRIDISGSPLTKGGRIRGEITDATIKFGVVDSGYLKLNYEGTVQGKQMKGTYTASAGRILDQGAWQCTASAKPAPADAQKAAGPNGGKFDLSQGIKCTMAQTNMIYYFKGDKIRFESPTRIPGVETYDIQIGDAAYYKVVIASDGPHAMKIPARLSFDQWYRKVVLNPQSLSGKPGALMKGALQCEDADLPDKLFAVPK